MTEIISLTSRGMAYRVHFKDANDIDPTVEVMVNAKRPHWRDLTRSHHRSMYLNISIKARAILRGDK